MNSVLADLPKDEQDKLQEKAFPDWVEPMLAKLTHDYFDDKNWIYERKLDGVRCLVYHSGDEISLKSRNKNKLNNTYPELAEALEELSGSFVADGEIVTFSGRVTSFSRLQNRIHIDDPDEARATGIKVYLYLFDLLYLGDYDITKLKLRTRKKVLKKALELNDPVRLTPHRNETGKAYLEEACQKNWEGIIAKDGRASYKHTRSGKWLKFKCSVRQEFVIGGFTGPQGERVGFGALLLGYYKDNTLQYAGQVGTGFDEKMLKTLHERLSNLERKTCPFEQVDIKTSDFHWVSPKLIGEIGFTEWTDANKLRHPRFLGLRPDKKPENVHKE
jgi:DNA ligase D-like protein (predicted ligase)